MFTYASPINSPYTKSKPDNILDKIEREYLDNEGNYFVIGDLNGRTREEDDFVRDNDDDHSPINDTKYTKDLKSPFQKRKNMDDKNADEQ